MPKLPSMQFYPGDWQKDPALRACSHTAKGVLMDTLCIMFECVPRGVLITGERVWSDKDWAAAVGGNGDVTVGCIRELVEKGAVKCRGKEPQAFVFQNASLLGDIPTGAFYSFRLVRDDHERANNAERQNRFRKRGSNGGSNGDVTAMSQPSSTSSSSSPSGRYKETNSGATWPRIEDVVAHGDRIGVSKEECERFWHHYESAGWIDRNGHEIRKWQSKLAVWKADGQQKQHVERSAKNTDPFWKDKARLEMVESEIRAIESRASHTAMDVIIQPKDKEPYKLLKAERKQLKAKLSLT